MLSRKKSSTGSRSTPSRSRSTPSRNNKKKTSKNNSNITYTIPDVYTFFSHSCNFINKFKSSFNNEEKFGRKIVPKNCILITYGDIGNVNKALSDPNIFTFIEMFKSGHKYFKEPLKYEKKLTEIFKKKLHFHYSDYYGKKPINSRKKFYAEIMHNNHMTFNYLSDKLLNDIENNFDSLVKLNNEKTVARETRDVDDEEKDSDGDYTSDEETGERMLRSAKKEEQLLDTLNIYLTFFNIHEDEIVRFIDDNDKDGYIEFIKKSVLPYTLFKTGLYKLKTDLIVTDKAKYYLKSSEIKKMFKDSIIQTKFNYKNPSHNNISISKLVTELAPYPNIKQSELFKSHPGIYYNFTCRVPCNSKTPIKDVRIQRAFSNGVQTNNNTIIPPFPLDPGIIASTIPTSAKTSSHYNRILKEIEINNDFK